MSPSNSRATKSLLAMTAALAMVWPAEGRIEPLAPPASARSRSGQLVVYAIKGAAQPTLQATNANFIRLEPTLVAISGERIIQLLSRELDTSALWRGKIFLALYPARELDDLVTITSERFADGWQYRVDMPNVIESTRYVRAMVQAVLLEMANRNARARSTEVPSWLIEGLTQQLLASSPAQIILTPPPPGANGLAFAATDIDVRGENPLKHAHEALTAHQALTFEELSWWAAGGDSELYRLSAQLFVHELLQLPDGPVCLRNMLADLAQHFNWQFAFLGAFHAYFTRPLDTEKWWALQVAHFTGRDLVDTWDFAESWQRLERTLNSTVEGRAGANDLPQPTQVSLQSLIRDWPPATQKAALQGKIVELGSLRLRISREYVELVDQYRQTLEIYLRQREGGAFVLPFRKKAIARRAAEDALNQLDQLDLRRQTLRLQSKPGPATQVSTALLPKP